MKQSTRDSIDAITKGLNAELAAYVFYKKAAEKAGQLEYRDLFLKLAVEEKDHFRMLETIHDGLIRTEKWITYNDILRQGKLPDIPEEMAETHRQRIEALPELNDLERVIKMAIKLEEEARDLYQSLIAKMDDPSAKEMYSFLSKFESGHVSLLTEWLNKLIKQ